MLSKEELEVISKLGDGGYLNYLSDGSFAEMATELLSLREQLAEKEERLCRLRTSLEIEMKGHEAAERQLAELKALLPVAVLYRSGEVLTRAECADDRTFAVCCKVEMPLFTAAKPAGESNEPM
ncbi:hypothetical protein WFK62_02320 [Yersinia enterocolitica]|uniref:hypothetical protein n=1 Tax=Yersinia enterocolitica TaxID=630 RepID=UPI002A143440|nr:hypothetical protein [Yersinia enterocolitica]ELY5225618.1 hypothetical protein [Yersinia enterocolitica]EMB6559289.1 hypothetical protein [Yersinia enterocolitica]HEO8447780.1 hypothetical protein [Yersinia enterocolitica]